MNTTGCVYFRTEDYASFWRRMLVDTVDILTIGVVCLGLTFMLDATLPPGSLSLDEVLASLAAVIFVYFVLLKRSRIGTAGYRLGGVRIVGPDGRPPGLAALSFRLLFASLGPFNWFLDLAWLSGDPHGQALRDKLAHTYVVKRNVQPKGIARVVFRYYEICTYNCWLQEIGPRDEAPAEGSGAVRIPV